MTMIVRYRRDIEGRKFEVAISVPDDNWQRAHDFIHAHFCGPSADMAPRDPHAEAVRKLAKGRRNG